MEQLVLIRTSNMLTSWGTIHTQVGINSTVYLCVICCLLLFSPAVFLQLWGIILKKWRVSSLFTKIACFTAVTLITVFGVDMCDATSHYEVDLQPAVHWLIILTAASFISFTLSFSSLFVLPFSILIFLYCHFSLSLSLLPYMSLALSVPWAHCF